METKTRDKRKILLVLPLLVMPFMALAFYAAGGGRSSSSDALVSAGGINTSLPDANFSSADPADKMGFYERGSIDTTGSVGISTMAGKMGFTEKSGYDKTEEINQKLAMLNREISSPPAGMGTGKSPGFSPVESRNNLTDGSMKSEVDRLELLMNSMKSDKGADPEMEQMNAMLEKILDIQNPSRAGQKALPEVHAEVNGKGFSAVPAEIAIGGKVVQGSTVGLRLLDSVVLKEVVIPKGHLVFGFCRLVNQRLLLDIKSIRLGDLILPAELTMYGLDGLQGLAAPDAVFGEAATAGAADAVSGVSLYGMGGIAGQVAGAGIDAAKSLFSRKIKVVRVKIRAGEKVLLRNNGQ